MSNPQKDAPSHEELRERFPNAETFFTSIGLYETFVLGPTMADDYLIREVIDFAGTVNFYCSHCGRNVDFLSRHGEQYRHTPPVEYTQRRTQDVVVPPGIYTTTFHCSRNKEHHIYFVFLVQREYHVDFHFTKIGQFPSVADLTADALKKYRKALSPDDFHDFNRAVGLFGHGIGIGAFVYLRRIFERLVEEAHQVAAQDAGWDEDAYGRYRMEEKVKMLQGHLPPFLVENWQIYGILSKGLHELSEDECKNYFPIVKGGVELILDQKVETQERRKREADIRAAIQRTAGALK